MENSSNHQSSNAELARARRFGDLVWADGNLFAYQYRGELYVMEPPVGLTAQLVEMLEGHPAYNEAETTFNEVFAPFEGFIIDEASNFPADFDWPALQALRHGGAVRVVTEEEEIKVEYIPPAEIAPEIFGEVKEAPVSEVYDPAVVMHAIHEMAYSLKECRQLLCAQLVNRPFTMSEHNAVNEARDLLESYCEEFGVDMDKKDLKLDGVKLNLG